MSEQSYASAFSLSSQASPAVRASTRLRQLLAQPGCVVLPGVYDGISARLALSHGFQGLYMTGAGTTASRLGLPDLAFASQDDFVANATMIAGLSPSTPLIADADTGFGSAAQVARTVMRYDRAGVAGLHIEDQVQAKRCGHLLGKQLVDAEEFIQRISAAVLARASIPGSDIVIIARTDAAQSHGIDEAVSRLMKAVAAGADVAFLEAITSKEDLANTIEALHPTPVLLNLIHGGSTPDMTVAEAEALGAKLAIFPGISLMPATHAIDRALASLKATGSDKDAAEGMSPRAFFERVGLKEIIAFDAAAGGKAYATGV